MRKSLILVGLLLVLASPASAYYEISDGSVKGLWHLNGDSADASGNGRNGTDTSIDYSSSYGKINSGALYNGSTDRIVTSGNIGITGSTTRSISAWIYISTSTVLQEIVWYGADSSNNTFSIYYHGTNQFGLDIYGNYLQTNTLGTSLPISAWNHIVVTYAGGAWNTTNVKLYINGVEWAGGWSATGTGSTPNTTNGSLYIGDRTAGGEWNYAGRIDEVLIANKVLSSTEISNLYNGGDGNEVCVTSGCDDVPVAESCENASSTVLSSDQDDDALASMLYYWFWVVLVFVIFTVVYTLYDKIIHLFKK